VPGAVYRNRQEWRLRSLCKGAKAWFDRGYFAIFGASSLRENEHHLISLESLQRFLQAC
jgi:hypothetical protein